MKMGTGEILFNNIEIFINTCVRPGKPWYMYFDWLF